MRTRNGRCLMAARTGMTLSGGVQLTDTGSELWANQVVLDRETGDSVAVGAVKVEYVDLSVKAGTAQAAGSHALAQAEPTHFCRASGDGPCDRIATFHGKPVRLCRAEARCRRLLSRLRRCSSGLLQGVRVRQAGRARCKLPRCTRCW